MSSALVQVRAEGEGERVLLFIHGWPDDASLWDEQIAYFGKRGYLCVAVTLPHCGGRDQATTAGANTWGYDFPEMADLVAAAAGRELERLGRGPKRVTLVIHDWGAVTGFHLQQRHPAMVDRIVALDVGPPFQAKFFQVPLVIAIGAIYQYALTAGFLLAKLGPIGRFFGDALVRFMARIFKGGRLGLFKPLKNANLGNRVTADAAFFYWHFHTSFWLRLFGLRSNPELYTSINDTPSCPCLFLHGANKAFPFHAPWWESALKKRADCDVIGLPAGHWIQHEASTQLNERMEAWLGDASRNKGASL